MGSLVDHPVFLGRNTYDNTHYAVVKVDDNTYELWNWTPPAREYYILLRIPASAVIRTRGAVYGPGGTNDDFMAGDIIVLADRREIYWRGNPLEWLEPTVWDIYTAASSRHEHLVGAPIRRDNR
jgi:hypothetical protein